MTITRRIAAMATAVLLSYGCSLPSVEEVMSPGRVSHDRTVADLERRAGDEDGWVVLAVPNLHEGGGSTTWWLHPCDEASDHDRQVTRTAYHGSDVAGTPGHHQVESDRLPCEPSGFDLAVDGRSLTLDVEVVSLGGSSFGLLTDRDRVHVVDTDHGVSREIEVYAQPVRGPCNGRSHWAATLESPRSLNVDVDSCVDVLAVLPEPARRLLDVPPGGDVHRASSAALPDGHHREFLEALHQAGFDSDDPALDVEDVRRGSLWYGPCSPTADRGREGKTRTLVDVGKGDVTVHEHPCR